MSLYIYQIHITKPKQTRSRSLRLHFHSTHVALLWWHPHTSCNDKLTCLLSSKLSIPKTKSQVVPNIHSQPTTTERGPFFPATILCPQDQTTNSLSCRLTRATVQRCGDGRSVSYTVLQYCSMLCTS